MSPNDSGGSSSLGEGRDGIAARSTAFLICATVVLALVGAGSALAVPPQRIYKDLADNGRLDARYKRADIERAFDLQQVVKTDRSAPAQAPVRRPEAVAPTSDEKRSAGRLPFTGLDLALLTVGGGPLLLIGIRLRRRLTPAPGPPGVARS